MQKKNRFFRIVFVLAALFLLPVALPVSAAGADLIINSYICNDNGGSCDVTGCWGLGQQRVGACDGGGSCCARGDAVADRIRTSHIMTTFTDPAQQERALAAIHATNSGAVASASLAGMQYQLLEKIPGAEGVGSDLKGYLENIYKVAMVLVVISAVFMLSVGGFMYLTSAGNTSAVGTAKSIIWDSLIGLVIALVAWLILNVINPDLVNVTLNGLSATSVVSMAPVTTPPAEGTGGPAGTCGGLTPQAGINCGDASQKLSDMLACMKGRGITAAVSSVSDSAGFDTCKNSYAKPPCHHAATSCHYGGGASKTDTECQASHAADLSVRNASGVMDMSIASAIITAASACGGRVNDETNIPGVAPHIHVSDQTSCCSL